MPITDADSNVYVATQSGYYRVRIINATDTTWSNPVSVNDITGIISPNDFIFNIYPNPSRGIFNISISNPGFFNFTVLNSMGSIIYSGAFNSSTLQINLSSIASRGMYLIQIKDVLGNILDTKKLIIE